MEMYKVGVITDGELGCNFALNLSSKGYSAVVYNTDVDSMTRENINNYVKKTQKNGISVATSTEMLINLINNPRIIFIISRKSLYAENILQELFELLESNDIIVLSPASASFDMYKNFEVRGNHFKELVNNLK